MDVSVEWGVPALDFEGDKDRARSESQLARVSRARKILLGTDQLFWLPSACGLGVSLVLAFGSAPRLPYRVDPPTRESVSKSR